MRSLAVVILACLAGAAPAAAETVAERARAVLRNRCVRCHGNDQEARAGLHVLDRGQLLGRDLIAPSQPDGSELIQLVRAGHMPPDDKGVEAAELNDLKAWVASGAPPFPPEVGEQYVLDKIWEDLSSPGLAAIRAKQRYISFNHLLLSPEAANVPPEVYRHALIRALNHVSRKNTPVRPVAVPGDPTGTLFRIDLTDIGWDERPFELDDLGDPEGKARLPSTLDWWDLVLLEYPYATVPRPDPRMRGLLLRYLREAEMVRPILYVRGDWLVEAILSSPLYEELLGLPRTARELEQALRIEPGKGGGGILFAGFTRGDDHHLLARKPSRGGASWWQWDVPGKTLADRACTLADRAEWFPDNPEAPYSAGGQALFPLANGLTGYYLFDAFGRLRQGPAGEEATLDHRGVALGMGCIRCHQDGVQPVPAGGEAREVLERADLPGGEKKRLLALFPAQDVLDRQLGADRDRHPAALGKAHGADAPEQPLDVVRRLYRSWAPAGPAMPVKYSLARERQRLRAHFEKIGHEGSVPEAGETILPIDGLTHFDLAPVREGEEGKPVRDPLKLTMTTYRLRLDDKGREVGREATSEFQPGDQMVMTIRNDDERDVYIEMLALTMDGTMYLTLASRPLKSGSTLEYPRDTSFRRDPSVPIKPPYGKDWYILFASPEQFPAGELHRIKDKNASKRIVHNLHEVPKDGDVVKTLFDPSLLTKTVKEVRTLPKK